MRAVIWTVGAVVVLAVVLIMYNVSTGLLPPMSVAATRGTLVPLQFTWLLIWIAVASGVGLAGFMVAYGLGMDA